MTEMTAAPDTPEAITSMSVLAFFAADHVAASDSKLYVNGGFFTLLRFPVFPATLPTLGVGVALKIPFQDTMRDHLLRIGLRGPDHQDLPVNIEARFHTSPTPEAEFGEETVLPFGVTISNIDIPAPGAYQLVLWLDGKQVGTYRMRAAQVPMMVTGIPPIPRDFD